MEKSGLLEVVEAAVPGIRPTSPPAPAPVVNCTWGTVTVYEEYVIVVAGGDWVMGPWVGAGGAMPVSEAVGVTAATPLGGETVGTSVIVVGMAVTMPGFSGT